MSAEDDDAERGTSDEEELTTSPEDDDAERGTSDAEELTMSAEDEAAVDQTGLPCHVVGVRTGKV
jgi:hypothetical protein